MASVLTISEPGACFHACGLQYFLIHNVELSILVDTTACLNQRLAAPSGYLTSPPS